MELTTILIVDDNFNDARLIRELLKNVSLNYHFVIADTIEKVLQISETQHIDLILLDLNLAKSSGTETFTAFYNLLPGIPIIVISGMADPQLAISLIENGAQDYFSKNELSKQILLRSIRNSIARKKNSLAQNNEIKFKTILESAPDAIILLNEKMEVTYWNNTATILFGYAKEDMIGKNISIIFPENNGFSKQQLFNEISGKSNIKTVQLTGLRKDKSEFQFECKKHSCFSSKGITYCCFIKDISLSKNSELKFQTAINTIEDGYCLIDIKTGKILEVNERYCKMTEYSKKELLEMSVADLEANESHEEIQKRIEAIKKTGYDRFETRHRCKSGSLIDLDVTVTFSNGEKNIFMVFLRDVTEKKKLESNLKKSEANFRAIFENTNTGFVLLDKDLSVVSFNNKAMQLASLAFGKKLNCHESICDLLPSDKRGSFYLMATKVLHNEEFSYESQYLTKSKQSIFLEHNCKPVKNEKGEVSGISFAMNDISQRKKSEEKLLSLHWELETFIYKASHELRGPLASILGLINISRKEISESNAVQYMDMINGLAKRLDATLLKLVQSLFINDEKGFNDKIDFTEIIEIVIQRLKHQPDFDRIEICYNVKPGIQFFSSRLILESIIQNLMDNAIKYQQPNIKGAYLKIDISRIKDKIHLQFEDNGIGIQPVFVNRIFDMYFRATEVASGSGLGLYIVKKGVEKLGGTISVQSKYKKMSSFKIILPTDIQFLKNKAIAEKLDNFRTGS